MMSLKWILLIWRLLLYAVTEVCSIMCFRDLIYFSGYYCTATQLINTLKGPANIFGAYLGHKVYYFKLKFEWPDAVDSGTI